MPDELGCRPARGDGRARASPLRLGHLSLPQRGANIEHIVRWLPALGSRTEPIFVEGHSSDGTLDGCRRAAAARPDRSIQVLVQEGNGKGDAVRLGFARATGDILMILDADLSVAPEDCRSSTARWWRARASS